MTDIGIEYTRDFIMNNPVGTICVKCKNNEQILAPQIENVKCFYCWGEARLFLNPP